MSETTSTPHIADDCPCVQRSCHMWGNCEACIRGHRTHGRHVPECMQNILRDLVTALATKVELTVSDARPEPK